MKNIFPYNASVSKRHKERLLSQRAKVFWFTGLSGSGKTTLARALEQKLHRQGYLTVLLDGDNIRAGLCRDLGFSDKDRTENIRRVAETAKLFLNGGVIVLTAFISPTRKIRSLAREIIGTENFLEIFVDCSLEKCMERDVKGLYNKARKGMIRQFTGVGAIYEPPLRPALHLVTTRSAAGANLRVLHKFVMTRIRKKS